VPPLLLPDKESPSFLFSLQAGQWRLSMTLFSLSTNVFSRRIFPLFLTPFELAPCSTRGRFERSPPEVGNPAYTISAKVCSRVRHTQAQLEFFPSVFWPKTACLFHTLFDGDCQFISGLSRDSYRATVSSGHPLTEGFPPPP